jgi:DNA-binding NtrC family response regulator
MNEPAIVLVDDDPEKRFLLRRYFAANFPKNRLLILDNCDDAVPLVFTRQPKVVVTNGRIAEDDGIQFASRVTRETGTPVIMVALKADRKELALSAGVTAFVEMGDKDALRHVVAQALTKVKGGK